MNNEFGVFLRELREHHDPPMTQEQLGGRVGKNKMTISLIERGKNDPPTGALLESIARALCARAEERERLFDLAAMARGEIPADLLEYFMGAPEINNAIRRAKDRGLTDRDWKNLVV